MPPKTSYAKSGEVNVAYQVLGDGPPDLVHVWGWLSHLDFMWTDPTTSSFIRRLADFTRLILFDKRGTGLSLRGLPRTAQVKARLRAANYDWRMTLEERAAAAADEAKRAEEAGDRWAAHEAWRRYQRILDAGRQPNELVQRAKALRRIAASARVLDDRAT